MAELILHHFDASPFAEKARLAMGLKGLSWHSVDIPMVMPKPDLMPLTGGYRKTPVLQIGAEVYCDTSLILRELDRRFPARPLFPGAPGLSLALSAWSDKTFFEPGAALSMGLNDEIPDPILADRKDFFEFMDFSQLKSSMPHMWGQFLAQVQLLEEELSDGRDFMFGDQPCGADILCYFPLWMARGNFPQVGERLQDFDRVRAWEQRMQAIGHGDRSEMAPADALAVARLYEPAPGDGVFANEEGLKQGDHVQVAPTDYGAVPVSGSLMALNHRQLTLRREESATGPINTHFPRSGYRVSKT